jgi:putative peptidoglycan lipid II flippase
VKVLVPAFYALGDASTPVQTSVLSIAAKIAINIALVWKMGFYGLALATAVASWLNMALLAKRLGGIGHREEWKIYLRILGASMASALFAAAGFHIGTSLFGSSGRLILACNLALAIGRAAISLVPLLLIFQVEEARELTAVATRFFAGRKK